MAGLILQYLFFLRMFVVQVGSTIPSMEIEPLAFGPRIQGRRPETSGCLSVEPTQKLQADPSPIQTSWLQTSWFITRGLSPFSGVSNHFRRKHPLRVGRVYSSWVTTTTHPNKSTKSLLLSMLARMGCAMVFFSSHQPRLACPWAGHRLVKAAPGPWRHVQLSCQSLRGPNNRGKAKGQKLGFGPRQSQALRGLEEWLEVWRFCRARRNSFAVCPLR